MDELLKQPVLELRKATAEDSDLIWEILQLAIERRRLDGSEQWQDGYPNRQTVQNDIEKGWGYVLLQNNVIAAYGALIPDYEPAYGAIKGKWITDGRFLVIHRVAVASIVTGKGFATAFFKEAERMAKDQGIYSIKVDTNFDNAPMLHILNKLHYIYCGEVFFRGSARKAFEKVLTKE